MRMKKKFSDIFKEIYKEHKGLFGGMIFLMIISLVFLVFSLVNLRPTSASVNTGYGDFGSFAGGDLVEMQNGGGYRTGKWVTMLIFPVFAIIVGVMHSLVAMRLYERRGEGIAKAFVGISVMLIVMAFIILVRLLGEG